MRLVPLALLVAPSLLSAQAMSQQPKPGPEVQKLAMFAGKWTENGEAKASAMGPAGKMTSSSNCEWFSGGFYLVCNTTGTSPAGPGQSLGILGFNTERQKYTYYGIDNSGMPAEPAYGTVTGNTWVFEGEGKFGGQPFKSRYTMTIVSPDEYTYKYEIAAGGQPFAVMGEGSAKKVKV